MVENTRRAFLKTLSATALAVGGVGKVGAQQSGGQEQVTATSGVLELEAHSLLSDPPGGFSEVDVRADGQYTVMGSYLGEGGSFLADLSDLSNPTEAHRLPSSASTRNADVKFDSRDGLYYRSQEPNDDQGMGGVEVVDYGHDAGSVSEPEVVGRVDRPSGVHNMDAHYSEPVLYLVNSRVDDMGDAENPSGSAPGITVVDTSDPANPERVTTVEPLGSNHDVVVDENRDMLHSAFIAGEFVGYAVHDISDPRSPELVGTFDYKYRPNYSEVGEVGFELCHYAHPDPEEDLVIVGDEKGTGLPGGKHVLDVGWQDGSFEDPVHVGFVHSPNAKSQDGEFALYDWTTHNHEVVYKNGTRLLVDGGYHEGAVVYDLSDPTNPVAAHQYLTIDGAEEAQGADWIGDPPMAWGANYNDERDFVAVSDLETGLYVFRVSDEESPVRTVEEQLDRDGDGELTQADVQRAISYWEDGETVPNTGVAGDNVEMTTDRLQQVLRSARQSQ
ncbi:LVIVD repeat-containing protein [Halorussus marinus]|uniref:LVIVD repeat-containing protein n=1 Tax=Halorussus marinus TaxID=2505976 RepID=UPI00106E239F|nr:twin-arginine translocation signal domain-containing protein [Halorussus marinus]